MGLPRFHCPVALAAGATIALPPEAFHHAVRVRRLRVDDPLSLFAGDGMEATARIISVRRDGAVVEIASVAAVDRESPLDVTLLQAISSGDRMDYTLQKVVELGATRIVPVTTERAARLAGPRADKRAAHWQQVVISACEQSGRNRIPEVLPAALLPQALQEGQRATARLLLTGTGSARMAALPKPDGAIVVLAGPEGGLTPEEELDAQTAGFVAVTMGPRTLRTETAAVAALAIIQSAWGDG